MLGFRMKQAAAPLVALALAVVVAPRSAIAAGPSCAIANVTPMIFATYHSGQSLPLDSEGELDVTCSSPASVQILLGRGATGRESPREMTFGPFLLAYNLFMDAARTIVWGDGAEGTQRYSGTTTAGQTLRLPIFGRVFALQGLPAATYSDRITVTVIF
jgi:spore coat protein U-like protein